MTEESADQLLDARKKAMDYLARREYGRAELFEKLLRSGFSEAVAEAAVAQLVLDKLQSDARFVEAFVAARVGQGKGPQLIRADLRARGIDDEQITTGLEACGCDWAAAARAEHRKKFGAGPAADFRERARQMRFLQLRGFNTEQIQAAVSTRTE